MIILTANMGNCTFYLEREFFLRLSVTKFKKLLKNLTFSDDNYNNLNQILSISSYKNKSKIDNLLIDYILKYYGGIKNGN